MDEAHYLKNALAKRTEFITPLLQKIKHVLLLTGTPALAKPKELFTLLHILRPDIFRFLLRKSNSFFNKILAIFEIMAIDIATQSQANGLKVLITREHQT